MGTFEAPLQGRAYASYFGVLRKLTNTRDNVIKFLRTNALAVLKGIASWLALNVSSTYPLAAKLGQPIQILSIGYGTGEIELALLEFLGPYFARIRFDGVEPNAAHERIFRERLAASEASTGALGSLLQREQLEIRTHASIMEDFQPAAGVAYDLILLSHVLYYPARKAEALRRMLSFLASDGFCLIFQQSPAGLNELQRLFAEELRIPPFYFSSLQVQTVLQEQNIEYSAVLFDQVVDVTETLAGESFEAVPESGVALLSFLCERDFLAPGNAPDRPALERLRSFIRKISFQRGERRLLFYPTAAIVAGRGASDLSLSCTASTYAPAAEPALGRVCSGSSPVDETLLNRLALRAAPSSRLLVVTAPDEELTGFTALKHFAPLDVEIVVLKLPQGEQSFTQLTALLSQAQDLANRPIALYGHRLGAQIAYKLAASFQDDPLLGPQLRALVVSGAPPPSGSHNITTSQLEVPIFACLGRNDGTLTAKNMMGWAELAEGDFECKIFSAAGADLHADRRFVEWICKLELDKS